MKLKKSSNLAGSLLLVGVLVLSGCGYKTDPVPPQTVVPKAINDLRYSLDNKGAKLVWSYPLETITGKDLKEISSFDLYRAEIPVKDFCGSCPIPFGKPMQLAGGATGAEQRSTGEYVSGMLRSGNKYFFKICSRTSWLAASADSNIVSFVYYTPASAPQGLQAVIGDRKVTLTWDAVTTLVDGSPADLPVSYQVLRGVDGKQYSPVGSPVMETSYTDTGLKSNTTYFYKVQSNMSFEGEKVDGSDSEKIVAKVTDLVPPDTVTGVTVVASSSNVRVFWDPAGAKDLAGYRIYRRTGSDTTFTRVGEVSKSQTIFVDNEVMADAKVYYAITAIDVDGNESKKSDEVTTRH